MMLKTRENLLLGAGLFTLFLSLTSYWALWPFMVELAGIDPLSYGWFASAGNVVSILGRIILLFGNNIGLIAVVGGALSAASAAVLLPGYTYNSILFSTIFQRTGFGVSMMGRGILVGTEARDEAKGLFAGGMLSSSQLGMLLGINLGFILFFLTGTYYFSLILATLSSFLSIALLSPWIKVKLHSKRPVFKRLVPREAAARRLILIGCLDAFVWGGIISFVYILAPSYLGAQETEIDAARTLMLGLSIPFNIIFGSLSDRLSSRKFFLVISELVAVFALVYYALVPSPLTIIVYGFLMSLTLSTWAPVIIAMFADITPRNEFGATLSAWNIISAFSRTLYPVIGGALIAWLEARFFFLASAAQLLIIAALIMVLLK